MLEFNLNDSILSGEEHDHLERELEYSNDRQTHKILLIKPFHKITIIRETVVDLHYSLSPVAPYLPNFVSKLFIGNLALHFQRG